MSAIPHRLSNVDRDARVAYCSECQIPVRIYHTGKGAYRCARAHHKAVQTIVQSRKDRFDALEQENAKLREQLALASR